jgi:hypothetical protein
MATLNGSSKSIYSFGAWKRYLMWNFHRFQSIAYYCMSLMAKKIINLFCFFAFISDHQFAHSFLQMLLWFSWRYSENSVSSSLNENHLWDCEMFFNFLSFIEWCRLIYSKAILCIAKDYLQIYAFGLKLENSKRCFWSPWRKISLI